MAAEHSAGAWSPYLVVADAAAAIAFYAAAFGAEEVFRLADRKCGRIAHAEMRVHGALLMLADSFPEYGTRTPADLGGTPVRLLLTVPDVDAVAARAEAAGATITRPPTDEFYGARSANLTDPFGHWWTLTRMVETVTPEEMQRRWDAISG
ncbi:VOC family protein [Sediminicoccus rosea]|uniref:VOC family protein n=1 Tax=Sediminicoccus rosea TaxID=1225128 RepID=A0ABZ0PIU9_9PROT|nr:VOC family protein [Sediminicoccus rosea]WPB85648.1 VOC family protein [Sediminicoccus rosea]